MKKVIAMLLCLILCVSVVPVGAAAAGRDTAYEETLASDLKTLGLFQGVSDTDFALGRAPTRTEALIMLIRVLGKESDALKGTWSHPFTDVASWADNYVGYAYETGLTTGVSDTKFGTGTASAAMYLTFVLRALGYSDQNGGDFTWDNPFSLARQVGILPDCVQTNPFLRADVVLVSYGALTVRLKNSAQTLAQKLMAEGVFTQAAFDACYDRSALDNYPSAPSLSTSSTWARRIPPWWSATAGTCSLTAGTRRTPAGSTPCSRAPGWRSWTLWWAPTPTRTTSAAFPAPSATPRRT